MPGSVEQDGLRHLCVGHSGVSRLRHVHVPKSRVERQWRSEGTYRIQQKQGHAVKRQVTKEGRFVNDETVRVTMRKEH